MAAGQQQKPFDPERFAAYVASFDNNPNEAEAMNAARMLGRLTHGAGLRVVDLFYRRDVMDALDKRLQPVREGSDAMALREAREEAAELRDELDELRREMGRMARRDDKPLPVAGGWFGFLAALAAAGLVVASAFR